MAQRDLLGLDFEGILSYFRTELPKRYKTDDEVSFLFQTAGNYGKVRGRERERGRVRGRSPHFPQEREKVNFCFFLG